MEKYWQIVREGGWESTGVDMKLRGTSGQTVYEVTINEEKFSAKVVITHHHGFKTTRKEVEFRFGQSDGRNPLETVDPLVLIDLATRD